MRKVFRFDAAFKNVHGCLGCDTCNKKAALLLSMAEDTVKIEEKEVGMSYSDVDFPTILRKRAHGQRKSPRIWTIHKEKNAFLNENESQRRGGFAVKKRVLC